MPSYILGWAAPKITPDVGSGKWCSEPQTTEFFLYKQGIRLAMYSRFIREKTGPDAIAHMRHYLDNTGEDYWLDMPAMLAKSSLLTDNMAAELRQAKAFSETLPAGFHAITSSKTDSAMFSDRNLHYAIGGYLFWGEGTVTVVESDRGAKQLTLDFAFHFYDRYNWDSGKDFYVDKYHIEDSFMQKFHRQCYAREFDIKGTARTQVHWTAEPVVAAPAPPPAPRRSYANPFDVLRDK